MCLTTSQKKIFQSKLRGALLKLEERGDLVTLILKKEGLLTCVKILKNDFSFAQLMDVCGVDFLGKERKRFEIVYHFLDIEDNRRLRVKVPLKEGESAFSLTSLYASAGWLEREVYDMFGIAFEGHPHLTRILTDNDFEGFPLRKDFPLTGNYEVYYEERSERVERRSVQLDQAHRTFDTLSPWKGVGEVFMASPSQTNKKPSGPRKP